MTESRSRRLLFSLLAVTGLAVSACTGSADEAGNGAIASLGDGSESSAGNEQSQTNADTTTSVDEQSVDTELPPESETGIGGDPAGEGSRIAVDEPDPVVESADGLSTEPVNGGVDPRNAEAADLGPAMPPSAAEICAVVEFGYLGLLDGDSSAAIQARLRDGATTAAAFTDTRYATAGSALLEAVGTPDVSKRADDLLDVCAADGFERLA